MSEEAKKNQPDNNKDQAAVKSAPQAAPAPAPAAQGPGPAQAPQKQPSHFTIDPKGLEEYVTTVNETIASRFVKSTLFNALNALLVAQYPDEKKDA